MTRIIFLFLDGVGIGPADEEVNPFFTAELPVLRDLLGGALPTWPPEVPAEAAPNATAGVRLLPLDACLGVDGLPQSGTGQVALLTGLNAPCRFGRHFGPWTPVGLRSLLETENLLVKARDGGARVIFANAYPEGYPGERSSRRVAAPPLAARAAGVLTRHHEALARGEAVASEIVNEGWRRHLGFGDLPRITPTDAGRNLARIAREGDLTLYAHYLTDTAGHRGGMTGAVAALERVDAFLGGILGGLDGDTLLVVASDHGNVEDVRGGHTRNPALGLLTGVGAAAFATGTPEKAQDAGPNPDPVPVTSVAPGILRALGV